MKKIDELFQKKFPYLRHFFAANSHFVWLCLFYYFCGIVLFTVLFSSSSLKSLLFTLPILTFYYLAQNCSKAAATKIQQGVQKDLLTRLYQSESSVVLLASDRLKIFDALNGMKHINILLVNGLKTAIWDFSILQISFVSLLKFHEKFISITIFTCIGLALIRMKAWKTKTISFEDSAINNKNIFSYELKEAFGLIPAVRKNYFIDLLSIHLDKKVTVEGEKESHFFFERIILALLSIYWCIWLSGSIPKLIFAVGLFEISLHSIQHFLKFKALYPICLNSIENAQCLSRTLQYKKDPEGGDHAISFASEHIPLQQLAFHRVSFREEGSQAIWMDDYSFVFPTNKLISVAKTADYSINYFVQLLSHLQKTQGGQISIGGLYLEKFLSRQLRSYVQHVKEKPIIFTATLRRNLQLFAELGIGDQAILECLDSVGFPIQHFPLDDLISDTKPHLTEENKKQIHLARALLNAKSRIVYFEAPLKSLSDLSAQKFLIALKKFTREKNLVFWEPCTESDWIEFDYTFFISKKNNPVFSKHANLLKYNREYRSHIMSTLSESKSGEMLTQPPYTPIFSASV